MENSTEHHVRHVIKFNGKNFPVWKFGFLIALQELSLSDIVDGTTPVPTEVTKQIN